MLVCGVVLLCSWIVLSIGNCAEFTIFTHQPSGVGFPERIEGRFTRGPISTTDRTAQRLTVDYRYGSGESVQVSVYPAPSDASL